MDRTMQRLRKFKVPLTERELAILTMAVVELAQKHELDAFSTPVVVQVVQSSDAKSCLSLQDQNLGRSMYVQSNPRIVTCVIPNGKYVLTEKFRLLTAQDYAWFEILFRVRESGRSMRRCRASRSPISIPCTWTA